MLEQIQNLEDKLVELKDNIKNTFLWILNNRYNNETNEQITDKEEKLKNLQSDYKSKKQELYNLKIKQRLEEDKTRDLELLARTQRELGEIQKKKIDDEKNKLNDTISQCKVILETNIPKFKELIKVTKENIAILKEKHKKCLLDYKSECSTNEEEKYLDDKNIYSNAKLNLTTLHNQYNVEDCPPNSCQSLDNNFSKLDSMYERKAKYLNYSQLQHEECLQKTKKDVIKY